MNINYNKCNYTSSRDDITIHLKKDMFPLTKNSEDYDLLGRDISPLSLRCLLKDDWEIKFIFSISITW